MSDESYDTAEVRANFPALDQEQIFFDNAGGSQILGTVVEAIANYFIKANVQLGGLYNVGKAADATYAAGYDAGARYINASVDEIVFGSSTTQLFRNLSQTLGFEAGDEIVVSDMDHEANIVSWLDMARQRDLTLKWWTPTPGTNPILTPENLKPLLSDRTRFVSCTHTSNILGTIHNIKALAAAVHEYPRAMICVDGVAFAPHRAVDVAHLDVDFYAFSWYKVYGPHMAMLYASRKAQRQMRSLGHFFNSNKTLADKLGLAGSSYELVSALPAVLSYLGTPGDARWEAKKRHEARLQETILQYLNSREDITVYGQPSADPDLRVPTISFAVKERSSAEIVTTAQKMSSLGFKHGHFYSWRLVQTVLGLPVSDGVVRVSLVHYNTESEVREFLKVLGSII